MPEHTRLLSPNFVIPNHIGLLAPNFPSVLPTYHPNSKEEEKDPGYNRKVSVAAAPNINEEATITNSSPLLKK
jgi:hypothetical protein